ncbi:hypothetical protein EDB81DRAFT_752993 [Dactylonectria macrodidyma]|uniref:LPXTG-motif cell wall anchor domain protein n=1 Tax=Dactylonectria macrodidyma TaxID=307937 RepID=A0A9P9FNB4_9HYPO|nr:hypothetical protein EDB81DRAFT_752993 [Dactylonectria macrodidyma]
MSAQVGFTSAGHLGHTLNGTDQVCQVQPIIIPTAAVPCASSPYMASTDSHRQSHSSSKLPSFRFADRKTSGSTTDDENIDAANNISGPNISGVISISGINILSGPPSASSAALSHPSLAHHAPPSPVSPNPEPGAAPVSNLILPPPSADSTGPFASPSNPGPSDSATTGTGTGTGTDPSVSGLSVTGPSSTKPSPIAAITGQLDAQAPDVAQALTLPLTAQEEDRLAHPTTHHHVEKQFASAPASTSASPVAVASISTTALASPPPSQSHSRVSSSQVEYSVASVAEPTTQPCQPRRPASFPDASPAAQDVVGLESPHSASAVGRSRGRRSLSSRRSNVAASSTHLLPTLNTERLQAVEAVEAVQLSRRSSKDSSSPPGQRELLLPKTLSNSTPPDDRRASASHRPPVSYRPPANHNAQPSSSTPVRVPPIRAFRSSGSRKSLTLDMPSRPRMYDFGDDPLDTNHDRTLRALEGRVDQDFLPSAGLSSGRRDALDGDDTGDVFLKIAREEPSRRLPDDNPRDDTHNTVTRVTRSHRRPLSNVVPAHKPTSPPQIRRRLSDQQETSRQRHYDDDRASEVSRMSTYRTFAREKAASAHPAEDSTRRRNGGSRGPPVSMTFQDPDNLTHSRRRPSVTDNSTIQTPTQTRGSAFRTPTGHGHSKAYNSSPLVRSFDFPPQQQQQQQQHQQVPETSQANVEGTESTTSTNAPSTVWDELDDLKSRIHRLELTGKLPSTSGAAVSRLSDERPPTATTTVTTMSLSPKRPGNDHQAPDVATITSTQREAHPLLHAALTKSKHLLDAEVFRALESAANDAMALSTMMGSPGLPGPISSGASTIGSGTTVTDRQLRRKADSVCRSLTELCVALGEDRAQPRAQQVVQASAPAPSDAPITPTLNKTFTTGLTPQRRPSISAEQNLARSNTSPRTMSKFEERRLNLINGNSLPAPRTTVSTPSTPLEPVSQRRSSLLVARTRRAGTEEPEDGRRSSIMLRTRRAGTEEPEEGRRTSLLVRNRRGTVGENDEDPMVFRSPSRAHTDLNSVRNAAQEQHSQPQASENNALASSALPRRRFASSNLNPSRLATPLTSNVPSPRRYLERSAQDRDSGSVAERIPEERVQRHMSMGQSMLGRTSSMIRRPNRDSTVTITQSSAAAGGYR